MNNYYWALFNIFVVVMLVGTDLVSALGGLIAVFVAILLFILQTLTDIYERMEDKDVS